MKGKIAFILLFTSSLVLYSSLCHKSVIFIMVDLILSTNSFIVQGFGTGQHSLGYWVLPSLLLPSHWIICFWSVLYSILRTLVWFIPTIPRGWLLQNVIALQHCWWAICHWNWLGIKSKTMSYHRTLKKKFMASESPVGLMLKSSFDFFFSLSAS